MKLALGTAQFGLDYGIANQRGQMDLADAQGVLEIAKKNGIDMLDTAIAYGDSEKRLGKIGIQSWDVVSKLPTIPDNCSDIHKWVEDAVIASLGRLKINHIYGLLLHRPLQLLDEGGELLFDALHTIKQAGLVRNIGVSIYHPGELDQLIPRYKLDLVQAPFNLIDRRLIESGWLHRLDEMNVELHTRSVFLQGLLLMNPSSRPSKFERWKSLWNKYDNWLIQNNISHLQACLRYALSFKEVSKVIVGVDSEKQLKEILEAAKGSLPPLDDVISTNDTELLNPALWGTYN